MKSELVAVLREISARLDRIESTLSDERNGLAAIRTKLDMVTDDHDEAIARLTRKVRELEHPSNGNGKADA